MSLHLTDRIEERLKGYYNWTQTHLPSDNKKELVAIVTHLVQDELLKFREQLEIVQDYVCLSDADTSRPHYDRVMEALRFIKEQSRISE